MVSVHIGKWLNKCIIVVLALFKKLLDVGYHKHVETFGLTFFLPVSY